MAHIVSSLSAIGHLRSAIPSQICLTNLPDTVPGLQPSSSYDRIKRLGDVVLAALLLVLGLPALVLVAVLIVAESGRPVLFKQTRIGRGCVPFEILKFRTLQPGVHDPGNPRCQVTRVGRVLRRWGLDELPQLWNVLRGEMSLVGPRPTLPEQMAAYGAFERRRLVVRPGLTGWAQIHGRNALSWPERIRLDVWYVDHVSFGLDLRILLRTPYLLISGRGLYGTDGRNPDFASEAHPETHEEPSPPLTPSIPLSERQQEA